MVKNKHRGVLFLILGVVMAVSLIGLWATKASQNIVKTAVSKEEAASIYQEMHWPWAEEAVLQEFTYAPAFHGHAAFLELRMDKAFFDRRQAELAYRRDASFVGAPSDTMTADGRDYAPVGKWVYARDDLYFFLYDLSASTYGLRIYDMSPSDTLAEIAGIRW